MTDDTATPTLPSGFFKCPVCDRVVPIGDSHSGLIEAAATPTTAAGREWLGQPGDQGKGGYEERRKAIVAIEAEARAEGWSAARRAALAIIDHEAQKKP